MKNVKFKVSELKKFSYYAVRFCDKVYKAAYRGYNGCGFHVFIAYIRSVRLCGNSYVKCYDKRVFFLTVQDIHEGAVLPLSDYPDDIYVNRD